MHIKYMMMSGGLENYQCSAWELYKSCGPCWHYLTSGAKKKKVQKVTAITRTTRHPIHAPLNVHLHTTFACPFPTHRPTLALPRGHRIWHKNWHEIGVGGHWVPCVHSRVFIPISAAAAGAAISIVRSLDFAGCGRYSNSPLNKTTILKCIPHPQKSDNRIN